MPRNRSSNYINEPVLPPSDWNQGQQETLVLTRAGFDAILRAASICLDTLPMRGMDAEILLAALDVARQLRLSDTVTLSASYPAVQSQQATTAYVSQDTYDQYNNPYQSQMGDNNLPQQIALYGRAAQLNNMALQGRSHPVRSYLGQRRVISGYDPIRARWPDLQDEEPEDL